MVKEVSHSPPFLVVITKNNRDGRPWLTSECTVGAERNNHFIIKYLKISEQC